ncbi:MAG: hypothetical protein ABIH85_02105 [Candidatus Omnitrophota bacterium]
MSSLKKYIDSFTHSLVIQFICRKKITIFVGAGLIFFVVFLAVNNYSPIIGLWEGSVVYWNFLPERQPSLMLSISVSGDTISMHGRGYALLYISRWVLDIVGHSLTMMRLFPVMYGLSALFLFFIVLKRWFGVKTAFLGVLLLSTNHVFLTYQHMLVVQMVSLAAVLFCIERFQNLNYKHTKVAAITMGLACALVSPHYIIGRFCMLAILMFYVIDCGGSYTACSKDYTSISARERVNTIVIIFLSAIAILFLFYPGNVFLLLSKKFIFTAAGEYTVTWREALNSIVHNAKFFLRYFALGNFCSKYPDDILVTLPYPLESKIITVLAVLGIAVSLKRVKNYKILFLFMMLSVTSFMPFFSQIYPGKIFFDSSSLSSFRTFFIIPFMLIFAVLGVKYVYRKIKDRKVFWIKCFYIALVVLILSRLGVCLYEQNRFQAYVDNYQFDFSQKAVQASRDENIALPNDQKRELNINQIYYHNLAQFIADKIDEKKNISQNTELIYIPEEYYTPDYYRYGSGNMPFKGDSYYFKMYLTFYLREAGMNVGYLALKTDYPQPLTGRIIGMLENFSYTEGAMRQLKTNPKYNNFIGNLREWSPIKSNFRQIGEYVVNGAGLCPAEYILVTNKEEADACEKLLGKAITLRMPDDIAK